MLIKFVAVAFVTLSLLAPRASMADALALACAKADVMNSKWSSPIGFRFDGDAKQGTLHVTGPFGDFALPATRVAMPIDGSGKGEAIDAVAAVRAQLPALAELRSCAAKSLGSGKAENDDLLNARDECLRKLQSAPGGADAVAQIRLGFTGQPDDSGEDAFVVFKLRYETSGQGADALTSVEVFPAQCKLKK